MQILSLGLAARYQRAIAILRLALHALERPSGDNPRLLVRPSLAGDLDSGFYDT
jgi:hypothetical protein